uniref:Uncharacterized protein n=1 Tax=Parascaris univalens TaxID=6257 RepID=A0A914ZIE8_PARUN
MSNRIYVRWSYLHDIYSSKSILLIARKVLFDQLPHASA